MIINKPSPTDFEKQSVEYLVQFINLIFEKEAEWRPVDNREDIDKLWNYHQVILKNALTLLFLALENQLKFQICKISPLLLLSENPGRWKTIYKDKDFHEFYIRQFDDLLALYLELGLGSMKQAVVEVLDELRKKRNRITHGLLTEQLTPNDLLTTFVIIVDNVWGPRVWWEQFRKYHINQMILDSSGELFDDSGESDADVRPFGLGHYINFFIDVLGAKTTGRILGLDFSQRRYCCPVCHSYLNEFRDNYFYYHAILDPNLPESTTIYCIVCNEAFSIERKNCWYEECNGNVIAKPDEGPYSGVSLCLACGGWEPEDE